MTPAILLIQECIKRYCECSDCEEIEGAGSRRPWVIPGQNPKRRLPQLRRDARDAYRLGRRGIRRKSGNPIPDR